MMAGASAKPNGTQLYGTVKVDQTFIGGMSLACGAAGPGQKGADRAPG